MKKVLLAALLSSMFLLTAIASPAMAAPVDPQIPVKVKLNLRKVPGRYHFKYVLFDTDGAADPGMEVWSEAMDIFGPKKNIGRSKKLSHTLGSLTPLDPGVFTQQLWLEVFRYRKATAQWISCSARVRLNAAGYALYSESSNGAGPGSISSVMIQNGAVTTAKIQNNAITGAKIQNGSVSIAKLAGNCASGEILVMGAGGWTCGQASCIPGDFVNCYTGPDGTRDVGLCKAGERVCGPGGTFGACDDVTPVAEACDGEDNDCDGETDEGDACSGGAVASAQIQAAHDTADGTGLNLPVNGVLVTYVKPVVGVEGAAFFIQAEQAGPALYVDVDPASLSPQPLAGDIVSFTITEMGTTGSQRRALAVSGFSRTATGLSVSSLAQNVSGATDLVSALGTYESELLNVSGSIGTDFGFAGSGYVSARFDTTGISGDANLVLRVPDALRLSLGLESGCNLTVTEVPMGRFNDLAQPSAWAESDISGNCSAPTVIGATPASATAVAVSFSRRIDPGSVLANGSQFTFTNGLSALGASASGSVVTVTTSTQATGQAYTVTAATSLTDALGTSLNGAANSAAFSGFNAAALNVVINELDYDNVSTDTAEFIELYNPGASPVDISNWAVVFVNGGDNSEYTRETIPAATSIPAGDYYVIGPAGIPNLDLTRTHTAIQNGGPDGVALLDGGNNIVDALSYEGALTAANITGITGTVNLVEGTVLDGAVQDSNVTDGSLVRCPDGTDTDDANSDWTFTGTITPGVANNCP